MSATLGLTALSAYAKEAPTDLLTRRYVQQGVETLRDRMLGRKEKQILNTVWAQSTDVMDDVYEADLLRNLRKQNFDPAGIEYSAARPYQVRIRQGGRHLDLIVRNLFLGLYSWNGVEIALSNYRSAPALYSHLYEIAKQKRARHAALYDWLIPSAEAAAPNSAALAAAGYFVITSISSAINSEDCLGRFQLAEAEVRKARKSCQGDLAEVRVNPSAWSQSRTRALSENITDVLAGFKFSELRDRACAYVAGDLKFHANWQHYTAKHACVNSFTNYCGHVDALVSCHAEVRAAAGIGSGSVLQSRALIKRDPAVIDAPATVAPAGVKPKAESAK